MGPLDVAAERATLDARTWVAVLQLVVSCIGFVISIVAILFVYKQLRLYRNALTVNALAIRHQLYFMLTDTLSAEAERSMRLHLPDQFDEEVYAMHYRGKPEHISSYLLTKRKYVYLVFALLLERHVPIVESGIAEEWVRELVKYHEFHHVHARHCRYYKEFSEYVSVIVGDAQPKAWMCDGFPDRQAMD